MSKFWVIFGLIFITSFAILAPAQGSSSDLYYCPMHPSYTSDRPGTCPICNMSLVKRQTELPQKTSSVDAHAAFKIDEQKRQMIGIKTAPVEKKEIFRTIRAFGKVARDPRWVYAQIFEYERPSLYKGEQPLVGINHKATLEIPALPGKTFRAKVRLLEREMDPLTRTTLARIALEDWNKTLKSGMSANVNIQINLGTSLVVGQSAVLDSGVRQIVFVDKGDGVIEPRTVVVGEKGDEDVQIISGLKEGEMVVVSGNFLIDSESRLKAVLQEALPRVTATEENAHGH